jgi:hypothetical protein
LFLKNKKDSDIFRICVGAVRPSLSERQKGNVAVGVYLRDISEIRPGNYSHHFLNASDTPSPSNCMSLVATERTISLELPSEVIDNSVSNYHYDSVMEISGYSCVYGFY